MLMWIVGIVGTLGVAGTIAACVLFPAVAVPILQAVVRWVLGCKPCLYVLAVVGLLFSGALYGHHVAAAKCKAAQLASKIEAQKADIEAANEAAAAADEALTESAARIGESEKRIAEYEQAIKARPNGACTLGPDDFGDRVHNRKRR